MTTFCCLPAANYSRDCEFVAAGLAGSRMVLFENDCCWSARLCSKSELSWFWLFLYDLILLVAFRLLVILLFPVVFIYLWSMALYVLFLALEVLYSFGWFWAPSFK